MTSSNLSRRARWISAKFTLIALTLTVAAPVLADEIHLAQGALVGEVTPTTALFQARLTASAGLVDGDVPGAAGVGRFEYDTDPQFHQPRRTPWQTAQPKRDFILKAFVEELHPATEYFYRVHYGRDEASARPGPTCRFRTLPDATAHAPVDFVLTSCMNYAFFHNRRQAERGDDEDRWLGYPALAAVRGLKPDFCIFDGDCVYYDHPVATRAKTQEELRRKWHEQHVQRRFIDLFATTPTYWLKDDHDHRKDDSDATGDYEPSHALGIATFREQVPVVPPDDAVAVTYRTHRVGRHLQLWLVEGRDYRSPNAMPDGPDKTIWGAEQAAWLRRTLLASDATFKILVSPTPMVGPDDARKSDNHTNPRGFRHEGEAFFAWLKEEKIDPARFFIICGDRHWKYHSIHPTGYQEFTCGALNRENSRLGRAPGDPNSTDPDRLVRQIYTDAKPSGGFLRVRITPPRDDAPPGIVFSHHDEAGAVLYTFDGAAR